MPELITAKTIIRAATPCSPRLLSKPIKLKDSINKIDKRIKEFIFLKSKESRNLMPIRK